MVIILALYIIAYLLLIGGANSQFTFLTPLSLAVLLIGSLLFWIRSGRRLRELGFPGDTGWQMRLLPALAIGILLPFLFIGLMVLTGLLEIESGSGNGPSTRQLLVSGIIMPALIATAEELIFRGVYFQQLKTRTSLIVAAVLAAALWAALHLPAMKSDGASLSQLLLGLVTFIAWGCTLTFAYLLAGRSLWAPIGIHFGYNLASSLSGMLFATTVTGNELLSGSAGWVPETGLVGVLVWVLLALLSGLLVSRNNLLENTAS